MENVVTIARLIEHLRSFDPDLPVAYQLHSENCLLALSDLQVKPLCLPRADGWVANARPDKPTVNYLLLPGN